MTSLHYIGVPSIDSLKLSFDIDEVDILDNNLLDHKVTLTLNKDTGEIENEKPIQQNSLQYEYEDYKIHFAINKFFGEERVVVLLNSKLLEENYMDGITVKNISNIYDKLMSAKVFHISFEDFLHKGMVSDIDIKKDTLFENIEEFTKMTHHLHNATKLQRDKDKGSNRFDKKDNKGIEWNTRSKSTFAYPFLKIYHKGIESAHGTNKEYFHRYLDVHSIKNVVRIETTIKNFSLHGVKYGIKDNKLISLLKLNTDKLNDIIVHSVTSNLEQRIKEAKPKTLKEYSPTDMVLFKSLSFFIQQNFSIDTAINFLIEDLDSVPKSRMKKKLIAIYESEIKGEIAEVKSRNMRGFFNSLGWE